jgi:N-acetylmuramoyl-L-alanine amidase
MRPIRNIIIHCSATPNGKAYTAADIDRMHKQRGFKRAAAAITKFNPNIKHIGYHYAIEVDGHIAPGRNIEEIGAHVQGNNADSIGICMIGTDQFAQVQYLSLQMLLMTLATTLYTYPVKSFSDALYVFRLLDISVKGHRDYSPDLNGDGVISRNEWLKICPGFDVAAYLKPFQQY